MPGARCRPISLAAGEQAGLSDAEIKAALRASFGDARGRAKGGRALLVIPDFTRRHSNAGFIANFLFHEFEPEIKVDLLEALGTHLPMTREQCAEMYGDIPYERFIPHNWRADVDRLGEIPGDFIREISEGLMDEPVAVDANRLLFSGYDMIVSIGQVVPHEVVGMANHSKNVLIGCGGADIINSSHMLGAFYGMERIMGRDRTPVRRLLDRAAEEYLSALPLSYVLTVTTAPEGKIATHGLYAGRGRGCFEEAVALAKRKNIILLEVPLKKAVVYLDENEFHSTWLGNKAIYRTRMAMADDGELIILAPGVRRFGEDDAVDALIRKYGYLGRERTVALCRENSDLRANLAAAAHLIHGSSDGRFAITYCARHLSRAEVEGVGFRYMPYDEAVARYGEGKSGDFYIPNPALGLWAHESRLEI